jgi:hypothetical protein
VPAAVNVATKFSMFDKEGEKEEVEAIVALSESVPAAPSKVSMEVSV